MPRFSSNVECARSHRKILRGTLSFKRRWTLTWLFYCFWPFSEKPNGSRRQIAAGCIFIFSRANVRMHFVMQTCAAVILRRVSSQPATHVFSTHSMPFVVSMKSGGFIPSITVKKRRGFSRLGAAQAKDGYLDGDSALRINVRSQTNRAICDVLD